MVGIEALTSSSHQTGRNFGNSSTDHANDLKTRGFALLDLAASGDDDREVAKRFGTIVPQYDGQLSYEVAYRPGFDELLYSKSLNPIGPHTEAPLFTPPPRLLALYCRRQARCGGGATLLADARAFLLARPPAEVALCRSWPIAFAGAPNPERAEVVTVAAPILSEPADAPIVRFSHNFFEYGDTNAKLANRRDVAQLGLPMPLERAIKATLRHFDETATAITIPEGHMLIWDNHRMLHGRAGFSDPGRHLTRYWLA